MLKVAIFSGSWPPDRCGVGDYAACLAERLERVGVEVIRLGKDVDFASIQSLRVVSDIMRQGVDILHVQYPTIGYGRSIIPALMPLMGAKRPVVVTLHEFSSYSRLRAPWFFSFAHCANVRIFPSEYERDVFRSRMKPRKGADIVLPIPSNIPTAVGIARKPATICYFGLLVPHKGIEAFLDLAAIPQAAQRFQFSIIGGVVPSFAGYADAVSARARKKGVSLHLNLPDDQVAQALASQTYAYLPYPDGASPRRGSLRAALANGLIVLTTWSELTPPSDRQLTIQAESPAAALDRVRRLEADCVKRTLQCHIRDGVNRQDWNDIAAQHVALYRDLLGRGGSASAKQAGSVEDIREKAVQFQ